MCNHLRDTEGITMNIGQIIQNRGNKTCAFVEIPDDVLPSEVLRHWLGSAGLRDSAAVNFSINEGPVIPWTDIKDVFKPIDTK